MRLFSRTSKEAIKFLEDKIIKLNQRLDDKDIEILKLKDKLKKFEPKPKTWEVGDRVKGSETCGFDGNMRGVVKYVEPNGTCWVRRDRASSDCFYKPHELVAE